MADLGLPQNQLATLLNALASIDRRLSRIEAALQISNFHSANAALPSSVSSSSANGAPANRAAAVQAGPLLATAPPAQPQAPQHAVVRRQQQPQQAPVVPSSVNNAPAPTPTPAFTPLEPPPEGYTISSRARMQEELDQWTLPRGYSMRIAGAKVTGKRKVRWVCFRGGEARQHRAPVDEAVLLRAKAEGRRKPTTDRSSKKCGCLFKFEAVETAKDADVWVLHYSNEEHKAHNHGPSDAASDPRARKLPPYVRVEVDQWLRDGWPVNKIQEELRARGFTNVLNTDLYNRKRSLRKGGVEGQMLG
jgi:hypothetical protein